MLVKKQILAPGTYWVEGLDGEPAPFVVNADDIQHFQSVGQKMIRSGLHIPVPVEHGNKTNPPGPVSDEQKAANVALNNAGWMRGYQVQDGSLWGLIDIQDPAVAAKAKTTIKYVSPYISPSFVNPNTGEKLHNLISHVALTPQPLFTRQAPFGASLSARSMTRPVALSMGNRVQLSGGSMPLPPPKKEDEDKKTSEDEIVNDQDPEETETELEEPSPVAPEEPAVENAHALTSKLAAILAEDGVVVEPCEDPIEFLKHCLTAYASHRGTKEAMKRDDAEDPANPAAAGTAGQPAPEPQYTAMSARAKKAEALNVKLSAELATVRAAELLADIDMLEEREFLDPDEATAARTLVGAKKMSLAGSPGTEVLELKATIKALKKQAAKTAPDAGILTQHVTATKLSAAKPVKRLADDAGTVEEKKAKEAGSAMADLLGYAPRKK